MFFSWQSDVDQKITTKPIRRALKVAATSLDDEGIDLEVVEATSNTPGAPYIPGEIQMKIPRCDVFVGDITPVVATAEGKKLPNANVTFELGYAVAHLGWERVILLAHSDFTDLKNMPFDFDRHRISSYSATQSDNYKAQVASLAEILATGLKVIAEKKPKTPRELEGKNQDEIKRERDLRNIDWFMRHLDTEALDNHVKEMPDYLNIYVAHIADGLTDVVRSSEFHLYDKELDKVMRDLQIHLHRTVSNDSYYRETSSAYRYTFDWSYTPLTRKLQEEAFEVIKKNCEEVASDLEKLLNILRDRYLEIDIDETNKVPRKSWDRNHGDVG